MSNTWYVVDNTIVATMSFEADTMPQINSQEDANRVAIECLPAATLDYERLTQLIRDGTVRAEPRWSQDGRTLEISLVRVEV